MSHLPLVDTESFHDDDSGRGSKSLLFWVGLEDHCHVAEDDDAAFLLVDYDGDIAVTPEDTEVSRVSEY